jgi:hypothetical protein
MVACDRSAAACCWVRVMRRADRAVRAADHRCHRRGGLGRVRALLPGESGRGCRDVVKLIKTLITAAHVAGLDETTLRCEPAGQKQYVLAAVTERCSLFFLGARTPGVVPRVRHPQTRLRWVPGGGAAGSGAGLVRPDFASGSRPACLQHRRRLARGDLQDSYAASSRRSVHTAPCGGVPVVCRERVLDPRRTNGRGRYGYRASRVVVTRPVAMSYTWPETLTFGGSKGEVSRRSTSAWTVACGSATAEASSAASGRPVASAA